MRQPKKKTIFVISDLHRGGAPGGDGMPSFQMCSSEGRARLAEFIQYAAAQRLPDCDVHLILNGDIVDFLAEEKFASFTNDDEAARNKLQQIIKTTGEVWARLRTFVQSGAKLTLLLGNHDTELCLPEPKRLLLDTIGPGQIEFLYDNQAFVEGPLLIEHGNRYDRWNVISHDALRAIRSALSRKEDPIDYKGPAGSQLVYSVMNGLKRKYPFVDLLKPEGPGVLPVLAVLDPSAMKDVPRLAALAEKSSRVQFNANGIPTDQQNIKGRVTRSKKDRELIALAFELAGIEDQANIAAFKKAKDLWDRLTKAATEAAKKAARELESQLLLKAFRAFADIHRQTFDVNREDAEYLTPAQAAAERGFKVVIFGHTHLVKRVGLNKEGAVYLNTGTWADLMKVPEAILSGDKTKAKQQLVGFLKDLEGGNLRDWRCQVPTFARVDMESGKPVSADVYVFNGPRRVQRVRDGRLSQLDHKKTV